MDSFHSALQTRHERHKLEVTTALKLWACCTSKRATRNNTKKPQRLEAVGKLRSTDTNKHPFTEWSSSAQKPWLSFLRKNMRMIQGAFWTNPVTAMWKPDSRITLLVLFVPWMFLIYWLTDQRISLQNNSGSVCLMCWFRKCDHELIFCYANKMLCN